MTNQDDNNSFNIKRLRWEFFKLHANQRLTFFRYYIGLLVTSFVAYFYIYDHLRDCHGTLFLYICLIITGIIISCITALFCYIDKRNIELIENAIKSSDEIEKLSNNNPEIAFKHKKIFRVAFFATFTSGLILSILGGYKLGLDECQCTIPIADAAPHYSDEEDSKNPTFSNSDSQQPIQKTPRTKPAKIRPTGPGSSMEARPPK